MASIPFPLPESSVLELDPESLAAAAVSTVRRVYGVEIGDYSMEAIIRLDGVISEYLRVGHYRAADFPATLALSLGAYVGEVIQRMIPGGKWGTRDDNLYCTPLPFLVFAREGHEQQINVAEDVMTFLWSGKGLCPRAYVEQQLGHLRGLGFE